MPRYGYACPACDAEFDRERPMAESSMPVACPVCDTPSSRRFTAPRLLFKADPRDNRPTWHNHDGYSHSHAPRRGRHKNPGDEH